MIVELPAWLVTVAQIVGCIAFVWTVGAAVTFVWLGVMFVKAMARD